MTLHNTPLPLVTDLLQAIASITASRVAYCVARNRQIVDKMQLLKNHLQKVYPTPPPLPNSVVCRRFVA